MVGAAGNTFQVLWDQTSPNEFPPPQWEVFRTFEFGWGKIDANSTTFTFTYHGYNRDVVHDTFVLSK